MKLKIENTTSSKILANGFLHHNKTISIEPKSYIVVDSNLFLVELENELSLKNVFKNLIITNFEDEVEIKNKIDEGSSKTLSINETNADKLSTLSKKKLVEECKKAGLSEKGSIKELSERLDEAKLKVIEED